MTDLFGNTSSTQSDLDFPVSLTERYRPHSIADFIGLEKPKVFCSRLAARPYASAWRFVGPTGTGKTSMALALAELIPAEIHHIPSQKCTLAELERVCAICHRVPWYGKKMHLNLVDEADQMTEGAQMYLLSKLDATAMIPGTIWIFTCNETDKLQKRFLDRTLDVPFSSHGIATETAELLARIWNENAPTSPAPNFNRIVKDSNNSVRR